MTAAATATATTTNTATGTPSTQERLLGAAVDVFLTKGYEQAGVQDIARAAGMTTGAIYANYRNKAELLLDAVASRTRHEVETLLTLATGQEAREVLSELGLRLATRDDREPTLLIDVVAAARRDDDLAGCVRELVERREQLLVDMLTRAQHAGEIDAALSPAAIARLCIVILLGSLAMRHLGMPQVDADAWASLLDRLLDSARPTTPRGAPS